MTVEGKRIRVCFTGGRDFGLMEAERDFIHDSIADFVKLALRANLKLTFIGGAARGVDTVAMDWVKEKVIFPYEEYPADWNTHKKAAGPIRNRQMLKTGIDVLIAFPGGKGTADMIGICKEFNEKNKGVKEIHIWKPKWETRVTKLGLC
jgi:hypothetical protein